MTCQAGLECISIRKYEKQLKSRVMNEHAWHAEEVFRDAIMPLAGRWYWTFYKHTLSS